MSQVSQMCVEIGRETVVSFGSPPKAFETLRRHTTSAPSMHDSDARRCRTTHPAPGSTWLRRNCHRTPRYRRSGLGWCSRRGGSQSHKHFLVDGPRQNVERRCNRNACRIRIGANKRWRGHEVATIWGVKSSTNSTTRMSRRCTATLPNLRTYLVTCLLDAHHQIVEKCHPIS